MFYLPIFQRKEFWIALADCVFSILGLVLTSFLAPESLDMALKIIGYIQPVIFIVIAGMFAESVALIHKLSTEALEMLYGITREED